MILQALQVKNYPAQATAIPARPSPARRSRRRAQTVQTLTLLGGQLTATQLTATQLTATATPAQAAPRAPLSHLLQLALPAIRLRRAARPPASLRLTMMSTRLKTCQKKLSIIQIIKGWQRKIVQDLFSDLELFFCAFSAFLFFVGLNVFSCFSFQGSFVLFNAFLGCFSYFNA